MRRILAAALAAALVLVATPAQAVGEVEYSIDGGSSWSTTPPSSLFDSSFRYVPGDTATAVLLIRSLRTESTMVMAVIDNAAVPDPMYATALRVWADDETGEGLDPMMLAAAPDCAALVPAGALETGEVMRIELSLGVSAALVAQQAQGSVASFDVEVGMWDADVAAAPTGCPDDPVVIPGLPNAPAIPGTGGSTAIAGADILPATIAATLLFGLGFALVGMARRRREETA